MSKLLVVFGATGQQGGSVANYVLNDASLSSQYKIRAPTRDPGSPAATALKGKGVEVVQADLDDAATIKAAVSGAHTVFAMTRTIYDEQAKERELKQGRTIVDAAVAEGAQYVIWSSEVNAGQISGGKYPIDSYDTRAEIEQYIRSQPIQSSFFAPGCFLQNFTGMMAPRPAGDGTFAVSGLNAGTAKFPWLDVVRDSGKFVGAILAEPEKLAGKFVAASNEVLSLDEVVQILSKVTGKTVTYKQLPEETYRGYLPPSAKDSICNMFWFIQHYGYYGPSTDEDVATARSIAKGSLTSVEEFFKSNPPKLDE